LCRRRPGNLDRRCSFRHDAYSDPDFGDVFAVASRYADVAVQALMPWLRRARKSSRIGVEFRPFGFVLDRETEFVALRILNIGLFD
jgi:hypothetical protein